jgi:hypothetical protein
MTARRTVNPRVARRRVVRGTLVALEDTGREG